MNNIFFIDEVKQLVRQYNDQEITIGKLTELLNEKVATARPMGIIIKQDAILNHVKVNCRIKKNSIIIDLYTEPVHSDPSDVIDEDDFQPCSECDGHDACRDFGCAIQLGLDRSANPLPFPL